MSALRRSKKNKKAALGPKISSMTTLARENVGLPLEPCGFVKEVNGWFPVGFTKPPIQTTHPSTRRSLGWFVRFFLGRPAAGSRKLAATYEVVTPPSHLKHQAPSTTRAFNKLPSSAAGSTLAPRRGLQRKAAAQAKAHQPSRRRQHHLLPRTNRGTFVEHSGNSSNPNCKKWAPCDAKVEFIETLSRFLPYHKRASPPPPQGTACFSLWFNLPGFHFRYLFLTHSHMSHNLEQL